MRDQETRSARLKGRLALGVFLFVILAFLGFAALPTYRTLKRWRADQLMSRAEKAAERGALVDAYQSARSAYGLDAGNVRALRMLADMYEGSGGAETLAYRRALAESGRATGADRASYLRTAIRAGRLDLADDFLKKIGLSGRADPEVAVVAADLLRLRGEPEKARQVEAESVASAQANQEAKAMLIRARGMLDSPDPAARAAARADLLRLAKSREPEARDAVRLVAASSDRTEKETQEAAKLLEADLKATAADRLLGKSLLLEIHPDWRGAVLQEVKKLYAGGTEEERVALSEFLLRFGDPAGVVELPASRNGRLFLLRLDALARLGRWPAIREELNHATREKGALDPFFIDLFQARVSQELRELSMADLRWKQAMAKAAATPQKLEMLGNFAEKSGNLTMATEAYRALTKFPGSAVPGYLGQIRVAEKRADVHQLRDILAELSRQLPQDPAPKNDLAYLNLLFNEKVDESLKTAGELVTAVPDRTAYRTTLALAYLRKNQPEKALAVYDQTEINWSTALPGWQAVRAAVLEANGRRAEARSLALAINWDRLKPQERDLVRVLRAPQS